MKNALNRGRSPALFADLYEFRMACSYQALGMNQSAVFSLFVRKLPQTRNYLLACGLHPFIDMLERLSFTGPDLEYLASLSEFPQSFLDWLANFKFSGDVYALPEGTPFFANEPILEIRAPIAEAQLLETLTMNQIGLSTLLASKAARVVSAASNRPVVDFGSRRAQGFDAALSGARAFFIAGVSATSNVEAAARFGLVPAGTMAHSYIEAFESETEAFESFLKTYPETILLVDTYDTIEGVRRVIDIAQKLGPNFKARGIRLDSGDLGKLAEQARAMLDQAGLTSVEIFASGGLDEHKIEALLKGGAPIDAFGVGTDLSVSGDSPSLDIAYKITEYTGIGRMKFSAGKATLPGAKQVFRTYREGKAASDVIAGAGEDLEGKPLLECVMRNGQRTKPASGLAEIRSHAQAEIASLPEHLVALEPAGMPYPVSISRALYDDEIACRARIEIANPRKAHSDGE
ncbi:MAG TPA: nicotinate phosphoribosyltransferase [Alphaproteobacteria bacterium]|nr:nicotinate phosphoribosyltransferase [Alphaproteobacteria bacterium]